MRISGGAILGAAAGAAFAPSLGGSEEVRKRKMTIDLVCGNIGVSAGQREAIELAAKNGFESVGADGGYLAGVSDEQLADLKGLMKSKGIRFGAAGLPVEFRQDEAKFNDSLKGLPKVASGLKRAGVERICTWLTPCHDRLTFRQNFAQHTTRLRQVAEILKDYNLRLGLEYVGPKTSWSSKRFPFIHTMTEMKELIQEIGTGNVGFLLDSWHWYNAGETAADITSLKGVEVVAVDLNDAPAGIPRDQQSDGKRELPCATGVIDVGAFLRALDQIGYDGPIRAEPFNEALRKLPKEEACAATAAAIKKAFALLGS
jgi:sugar phosphate isomerase/epimerase